mmetsp:Transcript_22190/g.48712  ORF Transcript_22190/g.48712 Transcript_22190/m.48712 type:complete len:525 (-) Transcript_22190:182-1756(-)
MERLLKNFLWAVILAIPFFVLKRFDGDITRTVLVRLNTVTDLQTVVKKPTTLDYQGPNDSKVVWAVFFYKPYCGACRRIKPTLEALGNVLSDSKYIRFASIDCVKFRAVCQSEGVSYQPRIRLYQTTNQLANGAFERSVVQEWQGALLAYELLKWFKTSQEQGYISAKVEWPSEDLVAAKMLEYKAGGHAQVEGVTSQPSANPGGYLKDIWSAAQMSLVDHVFADEAPLDGNRLASLGLYVQSLAATYPDAATRRQLARLQVSLAEKPTWDRQAYEALLASLDLQVAAADDATAWSWCRSEGLPGVGGYPCGMWLLFHTMLANADQYNANATLGAVHTWVALFFGCADCAKHFQETWEQERGAEAGGSHVAAALWLWRTHNQVTARLASDDSTSGKQQWPPRAACEQCYHEKALKGELEVDPATWQPTVWNQNLVFVYLQETFCFRSDTLACAIFYDPSFDRGRAALTWPAWAALALAAALLGLVYSLYSTTRATALKRAYASDANLANLSSAATDDNEPKKAK